CNVWSTHDEGPCQVRGYESALRNLAQDGTIDPERVGISGFSRTVYHVLYALTKSSIHFRAASLMDGVDEGYLQYLLTVDEGENYQREPEVLNGGAPYGEGLQKWFESAPGFNVDRITAPVRTIANRGVSTLYMWEPYAMLRILKKPVEFVVL